MLTESYIFVGLIIAFVYFKVNSRTNILFKTVLTGYQEDEVIAITMEKTPCVTFFVGDYR